MTAKNEDNSVKSRIVNNSNLVSNLKGSKIFRSKNEETYFKHSVIIDDYVHIVNMRNGKL